MKRRPFPLYHWSPVERRASILRHGLKPGQLSRDGEWRPPYVCFSDSPSLGWALSGAFSDKAGEWDLWMMWSNVPKRLKRRRDLGRGPTEYRVFEQVPKRSLWHVGVRAHKPRRSTRRLKAAK